MGSVYLITNQINGKKYVGITNKNPPEERWKIHVAAARSNQRQYHILNAIRKYGPENFKFEVIETDIEDKQLLLEREMHWIKQHQSMCREFGYNMNEGGTGLLYHTEESKKKMSENNWGRGKHRTGADAPHFGKKHSEETKQKIREAKLGKSPWMKGKTHTQEAKRLISEARKGKASVPKGTKRTSEFGKKVSEAKKGKKIAKLEKNYEITWPDGRVEVITGLVQFAKEHKLHAGNLCSVAKGKLNHYKGIKVRLI